MDAVPSAVAWEACCSRGLPRERQVIARRLGLIAAMGMRILLLLAIGWVMGLTATLFEVLGHPFSGRDMILVGGGLFLVGKATCEIHDKLEGEEGADPSARAASLPAVLVRVMLLVEGMGKHVEKGYIYFAMAFSLSVELVNMRLRKRRPLRSNRK